MKDERCIFIGAARSQPRGACRMDLGCRSQRGIVKERRIADEPEIHLLTQTVECLLVFWGARFVAAYSLDDIAVDPGHLTGCQEHVARLNVSINERPID